MNHDNNLTVMEINLARVQTTVDRLVPIVEGLVVTTNNLVKSLEMHQKFQEQAEPKLNELWDKRGEFNEIMQGSGKRLGMLAEHRIMWRVHYWILCTISGAAGVALTLLIQKLMTKI